MEKLTRIKVSLPEGQNFPCPVMDVAELADVVGGKPVDTQLSDDHLLIDIPHDSSDLEGVRRALRQKMDGMLRVELLR